MHDLWLTGKGWTYQCEIKPKMAHLSFMQKDNFLNVNQQTIYGEITAKSNLKCLWTLRGKVITYAKSGSKGKCFRLSVKLEVEMPLLNKRILQYFISKVDYARGNFKKQWNRQSLSFLKINYFFL